MEMNLIKEEFFEGGVVKAKLYYEGLNKGRNISMCLTANEDKYIVYVPQLFNILTSKEIPLLDGRVLDGTIYLQDYIKGYTKGVEYFKQDFPETHLMINSDQYFSTLHYCFFHKAPNFKGGWEYWIKSYPLNIHSKTIGEYGFCAGVKFCIDKIKEKNPTLFKKFEKCEHDLHLQKTETKAEHEITTAIDKYLRVFRDEFKSETDYQNAFTTIENFFLGNKEKNNQPVFIKNGNIKKLAFALGEIWRLNTNEVITYEYLELYKRTFSIFKDQEIDKKNIFGCNLYKYSISKT